MQQAQQTHDRAGAIAWAARIVADPGMVFLDTETTGLGADAEIVDVAIVDSRGRILLDTLVRPSGPIPSEVISIHGITDAMVEGAPGWRHVYPELARVLAAASGVVIYNAEFDTRIISQCNSRYGLPRCTAGWQCAMLQYAAYAGVRHARYGGWRWHKLIDAASAFGYSGTNHHRALNDTLMCRSVVAGMAGERSQVAVGSE
jgi:DNA polymerase-3 subunit epsilon